MSERAATRVDPHVKILDETVVERAKRNGIDVIVYAPHFVQLPEIRERAAAYSDDELLVVPGREVFTGPWRDRKHVLALGLSEPVPDFISLTGAMAEFERQNATVVVPHPEFLSVGLSEADVRTHRSVIDAVEVYNPKHRRSHNERAREVATELGLPAVGSSYAHLRRTVGEVWTEFDAAIGDADELRTAIDGGHRTVERRSGGWHELRRTAEFCHLSWENSWKKLDRVVLSGVEPTHPDRELYDGAFDGVAVY